MEENRRLAIERKRKSMQTLQAEPSPAGQAPEEERQQSKRQKTSDKDQISRTLCKVVDAQGQSEDEDKDEDMDAMDLAEFMD